MPYIVTPCSCGIQRFNFCCVVRVYIYINNAAIPNHLCRTTCGEMASWTYICVIMHISKKARHINSISWSGNFIGACQLIVATPCIGSCNSINRVSIKENDKGRMFVCLSQCRDCFLSHKFITKIDHIYRSLHLTTALNSLRKKILGLIAPVGRHNFPNFTEATQL